MTIPVVWLGFDGEPASGRWDQTWLSSLLPGGVEMVDGWDDASGDAVVVVTGGVDHARLAAVLDRLDRVILIAASDEEQRFRPQRFAAPNRVLWWHTPNPARLPTGYANVRFLPTGWTPGTVERFADSCPTKDLDWSFVGQTTHERRRRMAAQLSTLTGGQLVEFDHFIGGMPPGEYADVMRRTRWVPCPAGNVSLDTFRLYEALEAGAVPVLDSRTSQATMDRTFWSLLFGADHPMPTVDEWDSFGSYLGWESKVVEVGAWWTRFKRVWRQALRNDLVGLRVPVTATWGEDVTVVVTASPIPSHPDVDVLWETIRSINMFGPGDVEVIVAFDGVRPEQQHRTADYLEHMRRVVWEATHRWRNVSVVVSPDHVHQANTFRDALALVSTPLVLFMEHDTPLSGYIDWDAACRVVDSGAINMLRFHYDETIHPDHQYLMHDTNARLMEGCPVIRTSQWSQRPHLAGTRWYRGVLNDHFPPSSRTMIEDKMHSVVQCAEWIDYRLGIYDPRGPGPIPTSRGMRRSGHTDGRGSDPKYDMDYGDPA